MFGLTKREQRQRETQALASLAEAAIRGVADVRVAEAQTDATELARTRSARPGVRLVTNKGTTMIEQQLTTQAAEIAAAWHAGWGNTMLDAAAECAALRKDAERYRWLRAQGPLTVALLPQNFGDVSFRRWANFTGDDLDAGIDAAIGRRIRGPGAAWTRPCGAICAGKVRDGLECSPGRCAVREAEQRDSK